jgi:hypothetical protein
MKDHDFDRAEHDDRLHFIQCRVCGQWYDTRDVFEVIEHREHDIPATVVSQLEAKLEH